LLGCCTNLLDFYSRIGATDHIFFPDSIAFAGGKRPSSMRPCCLPEPFHLLPSLLGLSQLGSKDKLRALSLLISAIKPAHPDMNARDWLLSAGQSERAAKCFWEPVLTGALNDTLDRASARYARMVIQQAMLTNREGFRLGIPIAPLSVLHDDLPKRLLESSGAGVHLKDKVIELSLGRIGDTWVTSASGKSIKTDYVVLAVDPASLPDGAKDLFASEAGQESDWVPIVTLYLWFTDYLEIPDALCMPSGSFQWIINRSRSIPAVSEAMTSLALVASAARDTVGMADEELCPLGYMGLCQALGKKLPEPCGFRVVRHRSATFSPSVRFDKVRPRYRTSIPNVFLAGDWTDTGWPGTMEGAVRSGYACAAEILAQEGTASSVPIPDLRPAGLSKLLFRE
jgi:zeta-carotene desaturase